MQRKQLGCKHDWGSANIRSNIKRGPRLALLRKLSLLELSLKLSVLMMLPMQTISDMINNYVKKIALLITTPDQGHPKRPKTQYTTQKTFSELFKKYTAIKEAEEKRNHLK